jgi:hypothetical protein
MRSAFNWLAPLAVMFAERRLLRRTAEAEKRRFRRLLQSAPLTSPERLGIAVEGSDV